LNDFQVDTTAGCVWNWISEGFVGFAENLVSLSDFRFLFFLLIVYYLDLRGSREESSSLVARVANVEAGPVALEAVEEEIEADFAWPLEADLLGGKGGADSATALAQNNKHHQP
jgi:hypothetical protein